MTSIIVSDPISSFPRDQVPFVLRLSRSFEGRGSLGQVLIKQTKGIVDLVNQITNGVFSSIKSEGSTVYLLLGYRESLSLQRPLGSIIEALKYSVNHLDDLGFSVRIVLPIIKSKRVTKEQKNFFSALHKTIRILSEVSDDVAILSCPLVGVDPTSPKGESITEMANKIGHEIAIRKTKKVVSEEAKSPRARVRRAVKRNPVVMIKKEQPLKRSDQDRILIVDEIPSKFKRGNKKQGV